jgi:hypothetical protein
MPRCPGYVFVDYSRFEHLRYITLSVTYEIIRNATIQPLSPYPGFRRFDRNLIPSFIAFCATAPGDRFNFFAA